jgi:hypothetical protein
MNGLEKGGNSLVRDFGFLKLISSFYEWIRGRNVTYWCGNLDFEIAFGLEEGNSFVREFGRRIAYFLH